MARWHGWVLVLALGCDDGVGSLGAGPDGGGDAVAPDGGPPDAGVDGGAGSEIGTADAAPPLPPGRAASGGPFTTAQVCGECHANATAASAMRTPGGEPVAPYDQWTGTMMAHAARDPFFRAALSVERVATPGAEAVIESVCFGCHAPMGRRAASAAGEPLRLGDLYRPGSNADLARDGVSCTTCHQIQPEGLGEAGSFDGAFVIEDQRAIFGPHADPFAMPMQRRSGYTPTRGDHILSAGMCGTCHTLFTDALDASGRPTGGRLPEQTPYLEWRNSSYDIETRQPGPRAATCAGCHLPTADDEGRMIRTAIARNPAGRDFPIAAREPFGRHLVVGGNYVVPAMLRDHRAELGVDAPAEAFDAVVAATREQLEARTATLELSVGEDGVEARVVNHAGHKLPTAYPSRRMWLRVVARDEAGAVIFESGAYDDRGRLVDAEGAVLPSERADGPILPHRTRVDGVEPVEWSSVMAGEDGQPTFTLLRGARYWRDNRVLPHGWRPNHRDAEATRPVGVDGDGDFVAGEDRVQVVLPEGAVEVEAHLLYQVIAPRWADELLAVRTPETVSFGRYWEAADVRPVVLASARLALR